MERKIYRGGSGTTGWWTPNREYAEFFSQIKELDTEDLRVLDLTDLGVSCSLQKFQEALDAAGLKVNVEYIGEEGEEIYQWIETDRFQNAARSAGYDAVRSLQWHYEFSTEGDPQEAWFLLNEVAGS